jgi:hypothetical protein
VIFVVTDDVEERKADDVCDSYNSRCTGSTQLEQR